MSEQVTVILAGAAKIGNDWKKPGDTITVDRHLVSQLPIEGEVLPASATSIDDAITAAVSAATVLHEGQLSAIEARAAEAEGQRDMLQQQLHATEARAIEAQAQRDLLQARVVELQAQIALGIGADTAQPDPVEQDTAAAKDTSKKTASGDKTKG